VAVDAAHVYWANFNFIGRAHLDGSGVDPRFIDGYNQGFFDLDAGVAVQGQHVFWSHIASQGEKTWIGRANRNGTGVDPTFIDPKFGSGESNQLTADSSHLLADIQRNRAREPRRDRRSPPRPGSYRGNCRELLAYLLGSPRATGLQLHKPIRHNRRGTATLPLDVFGPASWR
jgi:hypothetical protein